MPRFVLENTTTEHVEAWLVATLRGYNDVRMPGRVGEIERIDPDEGHPYVLYWVDVVIPRSRDGTCYPMALEARMLQIGPDAVYLELTADPVAQPWLERLTTDLGQVFRVRCKGGVRGNKGDTLSRVADAKALMKQNIPKTEACKRAGIDTRTFDKYAELDDFPLDY